MMVWHELAIFAGMHIMMIAAGVIGNAMLVGAWCEPRRLAWLSATIAAEVILATITISLVIYWNW